MTIYNDEYAQRIKAGRSVPPEKWIVRTPLFPEQYSESLWYKEWLAQIKPLPGWAKVRYTCVVCGLVFRKGYKEASSRLCTLCEAWTEAYGKANKEQLNLFGE